MKALIVDDEKLCRDNLKWMIETYCPNITLTTTASNATEARNKLMTEKPDVVFLDVRMPGQSGIDLLKSLGDHPYAVVFTTAHSEYAIDALKAEAVDYLEKPVNIEDLQIAVEKIKKRRNLQANTSSIANEIQRIPPFNDADRIAVSMREGYEILSYDEIIHLEASESYTTFYLTNGRRIVSSKNIKVFEEKLSPQVFFRAHKSHVINVRDHLKGFNRIDGNSAVLSNGKLIPISRRKLSDFLDLIGAV